MFQFARLNAKLLFLLLVVHFFLCSSMDTITMNQTFKEGDLLISKDKVFAFGFFSPGSSSYRYLGIWFYRVSLQTVVWVANRNNPINGLSGFLSISRQGNLVLYGKNNPVWSANAFAEVNDTLVARLLDSGNLVLIQGRSERILWQSFDHPTNTLLPGMKLGLNRKSGLNSFLTSWRSPHDPATGNYSYRFNASGSPQFFLNHGTRIHWRTSPWPWNAPVHQFNYNCRIIGDEMIFNIYFTPNDSNFGRLVLDDSGLLQWLMWHQIDKRWNLFWSTPKDRCDFYNQCGANSKCASASLDLFECACLPGYEPKHPRQWQLRDASGGCIRKRLESSSVCGNGEGFIKVENVKLPDASAAVWVDMSMSRMDCEEECRRNCSCTAYSSRSVPENGSGCLAWFGELIDTMNYVAGPGYDLYVRVDAIELAETAKRSSSFVETKGLLIFSVISAWFLLLVIVLFWICIRRKKISRKKMRSQLNRRSSNLTSGSNFHGNTFAAASKLEGRDRSNSDTVRFNLSTILAATNNFSSANKIGQGGFGTVYKGQLSDGQQIAVKRMSKSSRQGRREFENEVVLTSKLQHKNLVKLLGCCIKRQEQILIYEYMPNKSLDSFLFDERRTLMDWRKRLDIINGIARGILYLHQDSRLTIIHRDLKSSNILLDAEMNPKISDFGMAKLFSSDQVQGKTNRIVGTYGYMSPEYAMLGKFSVKSDVFSFGIILLEIVSGRRSNGFNEKDPAMNLIGQVWELWIEGRVLEMVDSSLGDSYNCNEALRCIHVGLLCVQEDAMDRPTMLDVILMLKSETPLSSPKQPAFIFGTSSDKTKSPAEEQGACSINGITMSDVQSR